MQLNNYSWCSYYLSAFRANLVIQCENWWNLAKQFARRNPPLHFLSSSVQRTLMKALVLGGFAHMDTDTKQQYWTEVRLIFCFINQVRIFGPKIFLCEYYVDLI